MIFTGVTGGEIVSLLYPLFILSPFCYIIISKESLDGASCVLYRSFDLPDNAKGGSPVFWKRRPGHPCFAPVCSDDGIQCLGKKSSLHVFYPDGSRGDGKSL